MRYMKNHLLSIPSLFCFTLFAFLVFPAVSNAQTFGATHISNKPVTSKNTGSSQVLEREVFELINRKRAQNNLQQLIWSERAARAARLHSKNMASFNFFSHIGLDGKSVDGRANSVGLSNWRKIGENIAYNRGYSAPAEQVVERWMNSPAHRQNLLGGGWKESGVGITITFDGKYYFTQVFIKS